MSHRFFLVAGIVLIVVVSLLLWFQPTSRDSDRQNTISSFNTDPKMSTRTLEKSNRSNLDSMRIKDTDSSPYKTLVQLGRLKEIVSADHRAAVYEEAYDACNMHLSSLAPEPTLVPPHCMEIRQRLEDELEQTDILEEKIRLLEILVRWQPPEEQLEFVLTVANRNPVLSDNERFGLAFMAITRTSSDEDKISILNSFAQLSQNARQNHAHNTFQTYQALLEIDSSQGFVSYKEPLLAAINSFVVPDIPDLHGEPFVPEGIPEFSTQEEYDAWAFQNPAEAELIKATLSIETNDGIVDGMFARIGLELGVQGLPITPDNFTTAVEQDTSDAELYHTLLELDHYGRESDFYDDYTVAIRNSATIQSRIAHYQSNSNMSIGQRKAVENLYQLFWSG